MPSRASRCPWLPFTALLLPLPLLGQTAGTFRLYQGSAELGRETFRQVADTLEQTSTVGVINFRAVSRSVFGPDGTLLRYELRITNLAGDSVRGSLEATQDGDSLRVVRTQGSQHRTTAHAGRPVLALPPQSTSPFAELARRLHGRDTTALVFVAGGDTLLPVTVHTDGDSVHLALASLEVTAVLDAGAVREIRVPAQNARAILAGPTDPLPPLMGLKPPTPDYAPPAGAAWTATEVRVPAGAAPDTFSLGCTLTRPAGRPPFPAAITITGSGIQTRDESLWPILSDYRIFGLVAERLTAAGIAVLRCDDRSAGSSGGRPDSATTADLAEDTRAQVRWLRAQSEIAGDRIALVGHSEGAVIAPLLGAQDRRLAALVLMAGPSKNGTDVLVDQATWPIRTQPGLSDSARASRIREVEAAVRADSLPALPWMRWFRHYEPLRAARQVRQPVLILQGAVDRQVTAGQADTLAAAIRSAGNRQVTVHVYPGLNHLFLPSATDGSPAEYASLTGVSVPAEVLDTLADWLVRTLR